MSTYPPFDKPTTADVAAILHARTKDLNGNEIGDFTADTRPTGDEAQRIIDMAYEEVAGGVGANLGPRCAGMAGALVTVRAAMWIEGSYWPEQVRSDRSIYSELVDRWTAGAATLSECVAGNLPGAGDGADGAPSLGFGMLPIYGATRDGEWPSTPPAAVAPAQAPQVAGAFGPAGAHVGAGPAGPPREDR